MSDVEKRFAERMKAARAARYWSAQELSNRSGVSRVAISKIETGDRGIPLGDAVALSEALGVSLADMTRPGEFFIESTITYKVGGRS
jgi:transcriptional regulator with XRE-family HTH domain